MKYQAGPEEQNIYHLIASHDGIKAREIGKLSGLDKTTVNRYLYQAPFMKELCYRDDQYLWHGMIRQSRPHTGLGEYCGYYGTVKEFLSLSEEAWMESLMDGCRHIGRNLNDIRGLLHSFRDCRSTVTDLFEDIPEDVPVSDWEIAFELRLNRAKYIRIYADVLVITEDKVFSLEFKMKDKINPEEVAQAAKYVPYQEVLFGPEYDVIPALVLTKAEDLYTYQNMTDSTAQIAVASGDMLFNLFDEYLGFLQQ